MAKKNDGKKYERATGAGIEIEIELRNRLLMQSYEFTFERTDNQLVVLSQWKGAGEAIKQLKELFSEQHAALDKYVEQVAALCQSNGVKPAFTGKTLKATAVVLTPYSGDYLRLIRRTDEATSYLHALWVSGIADDEAFKEQAHKLRGRVHQASKAVDEVFHRVVKNRGEEASQDVGYDGKSSASKASEEEVGVAVQEEIQNMGDAL